MNEMRGLTFRYVLEVLIPGHLDTGVQGAGLVGGTGRDHVSRDGLQPITTCSRHWCVRTDDSCGGRLGMRLGDIVSFPDLPTVWE